MLLFLKSLPINCHFNIVRFGSQYKSLFQNITAVYNEENARQAEELTNNMKADLGGIELVSILIFFSLINCNQLTDLVTSVAMASRESTRSRSWSPNISSYRW
jgi:hypothetical protein